MDFFFCEQFAKFWRVFGERPVIEYQRDMHNVRAISGGRCFHKQKHKKDA